MAAIDRELLMTLTEALAALVQRVNAVEGVARIPGPPPTTAEIKAAAEKWLNANRDSLRGQDGESVTSEQVQAFAVEWLSANITQPKDGDPGRDPTAAEIQTAVELWLEFNRESLKGEDGADATPEMVAQAVREWLIANPIRVPNDGENASPEMVADAVTAWLADNPIRVPKDGDDGDDGTDGVGIDRIEQPSEDTARVILTDGREYDLTLPRGKDGITQTLVRGGGVQHGGVAGGAVESVNGQTGVVVLTAADVGAEVAGAVAAHEAATNPHPQYLTQAEGDALYQPIGGGGGSAAVPTYVQPGEVYTVEADTQALFRKRIKLGSGARIKLKGILVGV